MRDQISSDKKNRVREKGLLGKLAMFFARERNDGYGDMPSFEQLEQRVLFSANPLSDTWSPDQEQYTDNAVVAMPLIAGETGVMATSAGPDVSVPSIVSVSPVNKSLLNGPVEVTATVRDIDSATLDWRVTITNKDTGQTHVMTGDALSVPGKGNYTFSLGTIDPAVIGDGNFLLSFQITDPGGNTVAKEVNFTMDATAPVVESITANKEVLQTFESIKFTVNASDNVGVTKYAFSLNGVQKTTGSSFTHTFTEAGTYVLTAVAYDKAGNASETYTRVITVAECPDVNAPIVEVSVHNNKYYKNNTAITVSVWDKDSLEIDWTATLINHATGERYAMGAGNRPINAETLLTLQKEVFPDGLYTIEIEAIDKGGNRTFDTRTFRFDTTAPAITIETGSERFETGTMRLTLNIEDESPLSLNSVGLTVNGRTVTGLNSSHLSALYEFTEPGEYTLVAKAKDSAGNTSTVTRIITITENTDFAPPSVTVHSPANGAYHNDDVPIKLTVSDDQDAYLQWTVRMTTPNDSRNLVCAKGEGPITEEVVYIRTATVNGEYTLEVEAIDAAGNVTVERITFVVDRTIPSASTNNYNEFKRDSQGWAHLKDPYRLEWTVDERYSPEDLVTWKVLCANRDTGESVVLKSGNGFSADVTIDPALLASGHYQITLQVVDAAGNIGTSPVFKVEMDTVPPVVHSVTYEAKWYGINLLATVTDDYDLYSCHYFFVSSPKDIRPDMEWHMAEKRDEVNVWSSEIGARDVPAPKGTYVIKVVATDKCGNQSEPQYITIVKDW